MAETSSRVRLIFEGSERGVVAAAAKSAAAIRGLNDQNTKVGQSFAKADQQATKFIGTVTKVAATTSLVAAAGGLIGQGLAGGAAAFTELGFAALTVKLGMDGIKKAAEGAKKPFDDLKTAVSGTFEKGFKQPVADVAALLPKLTAGFTGVAASISGMVGQVARVGASAEGVAKLQSILAGTRVFIDGMAPGLARLTAGFLTIASNATPSMHELGAAVGDVFGKLGDVLKNLPFDTVNAAIRGFAATLGGIGSVLGSVVNLAVRLGAALGDSLGVVLDNLSVGLDKASPGLTDLAGAVGELLKAAAPLLPVIGELASQFAGSLASGIRAVIPYVQQFAAWAQNNVGTIKAVAEGIAALAFGVKALNIFTSVLGWVDGAVGALTRFRTAAETSRVAAAGMALGLAALKVVGVGVALVGIGLAAEKMGGQADTASGQVTGLRDSLATFGKAAGELNLGFFIDQFVEEVKFGQTVWMQFKNTISGFKPEPINFSVSTGPAQAQVVEFMNSLKGKTASVNIDGRTEDATQALADVVQAIGQGRGTVNIDGSPVAAQDALQKLITMVNTAVGNVMINGESRPAGEVLAEFLQRAQGSTATATLDANGGPALETVNGWTRAAEGTVGMAALDANKAPADGKTSEWVGGVSRTRGTATLDANPGAANTQLGGWKGRADATTGRSKLDADPALGNAKVAGWKGTADRTTGTAKINADPGQANSVLQGLKNAWNNTVITVKAVLQKIGFADGGPVLAGMGGFASGGAIRGRGTGTSDSIPAMLSNGEHVLTAREVAAAGGHAAIFALRKQLMRGRVPRMNAVGGRAATGGAVSPATALPTPQVAVAVHIGNKEITDIVRTEINTSSRATRRTVGMGAGTSF